MSKVLCATVTGETRDDVVIALEEVIRLVKEGFTSGVDSNDSGSLNFVIKEE